MLRSGKYRIRYYTDDTECFGWYRFYPAPDPDPEDITGKQMNYPQPTHVGRGFCYAARRHEPAGIVYPAEQGMSTMPLSHRVTFGNTFLKMFAAPLMSALVTVPS